MVLRLLEESKPLDEVIFFDNENGFVEKAEYKNGTLITKGGNIPEWIKELGEKIG